MKSTLLRLTPAIGNSLAALKFVDTRPYGQKTEARREVDRLTHMDIQCEKRGKFSACRIQMVQPRIFVICVRLF